MAIKHAPRRPAGQSGQWQTATADEEWQPVRAAGDGADDDQASGLILALIYQAGLYGNEIDAEYRSWQSGDATLLASKDASDRGGMRGLSQLAAAASERTSDSYERARVAVGAVDQYRIDYLENSRARKPTLVAADGEHRWRVYPDRVTVGPAVPLPPEIAAMLDPAWLLDWRLTGGSPVRLNDRAGYVIGVHQPVRPAAALSLPDRAPAEAVIDAELGILLRLRFTYSGRDHNRYELRQVVSSQPRDPAGFRLLVPDGVPVVADTGRILDESDAPPAMKVAADLAGRALAGAAAASTLADRFRRGRRRDQSGPG